ncbi:MAG: hypothetical protein ACXITR_06525 [Cyanobacterium sp.]
MKQELLQIYKINVKYPDVSGFEHLETLQIRDQLALIETELSETEKQQLSLADQLLIKNAQGFYTELSTVVDLKKKRESENISPVCWWWYLDVLANLPQLISAAESVTQ